MRFVPPARVSPLLRRGVVAALTAGSLGLAVPTQALAATDTWYDPSALATSCAEETSQTPKADRCRFEPAQAPTFVAGAKQQVSGRVANCTADPATLEMSWSQTTGQESSISVTASASASLFSVIDAGLSTTYGNTWSKSFTATSTINQTIAADKVGWLERTQTMTRTSGRLVVNYGKRVHGHYEWYVYPTVTAPAPDVHTFDLLVLQTRPMTAADRTTLCGADSIPAGMTVLKATQAKDTASTSWLRTSTSWLHRVR